MLHFIRFIFYAQRASATKYVCYESDELKCVNQ